MPGICFGESPELFEAPIHPLAKSHAERALKQRFVKVNVDLLRQSQAPGSILPLNCFPGKEFRGQVTSLQRYSPDRFSLAGNLLEDADSRFTVVLTGESATMNIRHKGTLFTVRQADTDHELVELPEAEFPPCPVGDAMVPKPLAGSPIQFGDTADPEGIIDVMVLYTPAARSAAGGTSKILDLITLAITEGNLAYSDSGVITRIRLVHTAEVNYVESGSFGTDLDRLTYKDGILDEAHTHRDTYGADLVSLWINNSSSCGLAWQMSALSSGFESSAFSVTHWGCVDENYSFIHEMGHNMGASHDRANSTGGLDSYSYGWRFNGLDTIQYRTIMAYAPGKRIGHFSNPNVRYQGTPTGVAIGAAGEAANAQTINNSAYVVANFRPSKLGTNLPPFIITHPEPAFAFVGENASFSVEASGSPPLSYFWRKDGNVLSVSGTNTFTVTNANFSNAGSYSVVVSNVAGSTLSSNALLTIGLSLALAVDNDGLPWGTFGDADWAGQTNLTFDGVDAAVSGVIGDGGYSSLSTTVPGPGTLSFWWRVSSEADFDFLDVFVNDGNASAWISGEKAWAKAAIDLPPGTNEVIWQYSKDANTAYGQDRGWIDQVVFSTSVGAIAHQLAGTNSAISFNARQGASYSLMASSNLTTWVPLTNAVSPSNGVFRFVGPRPVGWNSRFYRVRSP
jgi:hypothetical protein